MLILAGVSINALVGDNGIITMAQEAKEVSEEVQRKEDLEMMLIGYVANLDTDESVETYLTTRVGKEIDEVFKIPDPNGSGRRICAVRVGEYYYAITGEEGNYTIEPMNAVASNIGSGITIATKDNFQGGTMNFDPGENGTATLVFSDRINAEYNFNITSGEVTIYIDNDMTLTNQGMKRSAINIEPGAILNLNIAEEKTLTVDSGFGEKGEIATTANAEGGPGGYAGIRVPWIDNNNNGIRDEGEYATINLCGNGTLIAYGGNAGGGGSAIGDNKGGAGGGRCWSRNWWQWRKRRKLYQFARV